MRKICYSSATDKKAGTYMAKHKAWHGAARKRALKKKLKEQKRRAQR